MYCGEALVTGSEGTAAGDAGGGGGSLGGNVGKVGASATAHVASTVPVGAKRGQGLADFARVIIGCM